MTKKIPLGSLFGGYFFLNPAGFQHRAFDQLQSCTNPVKFNLRKFRFEFSKKCATNEHLRESRDWEMSVKHVLQFVLPGLAGLALILSLVTLYGSESIDSVQHYHPRVADLDFEDEYSYGFNLDSFAVFSGTIKPNEFLANILLKYEVNYQDIDRLSKQSKPVFDVRRLASGNKYAVLCKKGEEKGCYFVYERNAEDYVIFSLQDSLYAQTGKKPVEYVEREVSGEIKTSLYDALVEQKVTPLLAYDMASIYAWTIDFYRLQKGDRFKVIFEEKIVDGKSSGIGLINAALFEHMNTDNYAFYFHQAEDVTLYFDDKGNSLQKTFLKAPLKYSRISSGYTRRRFHPIQKRYKAHLGTDYAAPHGTPIMAVGDGVVKEARRKGGNGNYVKIRHNGTYSSQYLHMSRFGKGIRPGVRVKQGQIIGYVGSTGLATGPHVCYRFWKHGRQVNHLKEKFPPAKPVAPEYREEFDAFSRDWMDRLDQISWPGEQIVAQN